MSKAIARDPIYRRRRFQPEIIELCVRWYLTYRLSYRDLVEMMAERGVVISHSTILRLRGSARLSLSEPTPWLLSIGPGNVTSLFVTYSPMQSIPRR
jgi:hypothetical protein